MEKQSSFSWPLRVYYQDTDAGGVVFHSNYLNFMERARTEWLFKIGLSPADLNYHHNLLFVVRSITIDYFKPAKLNDMLDVTAEVVETGACHLLLQQRVFRDEQLLVEAAIQLVSVNSLQFKPVPLPAVVKEKILGVFA